MDQYSKSSEDYHRIEKAIRFIENQAHHQPSLAEVAAHVNLSEYHFHRLFSRWAGISPKRFLQFITRENAKSILDNDSVLNAAYEVGLSSPSRLHDLFIQTEAVTPGEYRSRGMGVTIQYGYHETPFGKCLLAMTGRGICFLGFYDTDRLSILEKLRAHWTRASLQESPDTTAVAVHRIFTPAFGEKLDIHLFGTNFQIKVWEALLQLPPGQAISYGHLAEAVGNPGAAQAVGNALASNPVAYLIPCHRVFRQGQFFGEYRYGSARKKAILLYESEVLRKDLPRPDAFAHASHPLP